MSNEELVTRIKAGIDTADNMLALWLQNEKFIHMIAKRYEGVADVEDLEQEGYLALYAAVDGYEAERGYKFLTYAEWWIRQYIQRYIQNNGTAVRIPVHERERLCEYEKVVGSYVATYGKKPTRYEIADEMGVSVKVIRVLEKTAKMKQVETLDAHLLDGDGDTLGERLADDVDVEADVLEDVYQKQLKSVIWTSVDALPEQQRNVIRQRFQEGKTYSETSEKLGMTLTCVRTEQDKAFRSLRRCKALKVFLSDDEVYSMGIKGNGVARFNRTWTSSTERAAFKRSGL